MEVQVHFGLRGRAFDSQPRDLHRPGIKPPPVTVDSNKLECGFRVVCAGLPSFVLESGDGHIPTSWLLL